LQLQDPFVGKKIEKCLIRRQIARGGYGLTYLAFDEELREDHVIKISLTKMSQTLEGNLNSFIEEGLILSRLKHPQIVTLRAQGEAFQHRYMILDYVHGFSLKSVIDFVTKRQEELDCAWEDLVDPVAATAFILSTLYPLAYAHQANVHLPDREVFGVAHRDIAPGNLILGNRGNEKGRIILIDFGTAKTEISEMFTTNQNLVGTVPYMSKARLQKATSGTQVATQKDFWTHFKETQHDIHALGVLYYQLLTGKLPFTGEASPQIIVNILDSQLYQQCLFDLKHFPPAIAELISKCIVYHDFNKPYNQQRYQFPNASVMLQDAELLFQSLCPQQSPEEILSDFCIKLNHPERWQPKRQGLIYAASNAQESSAVKEPPTRYKTLYLPLSKKSISIYSGVIGFSLVCFIAAIYFYQLQKQQDKVLARSLTHQPNLENLNSNIGMVDSRDSTINSTYLPKTKAYIKSKKTMLIEDIDPPKMDLPLSKSIYKIDKNQFNYLEDLVRNGSEDANEKLKDALNANPNSPDLLFLKCILLFSKTPTSPEARDILSKINSEKPKFTHPLIFHENALYLLWQLDANLFDGLNTPESRKQLEETSHLYLNAFHENPIFAQKVKTIENKLRF
jgi:serine/threonine protein kinase